jgi:hypothetical protein
MPCHVSACSAVRRRPGRPTTAAGMRWHYHREPDGRRRHQRAEGVLPSRASQGRCVPRSPRPRRGPQFQIGKYEPIALGRTENLFNERFATTGGERRAETSWDSALLLITQRSQVQILPCYYLSLIAVRRICFLLRSAIGIRSEVEDPRPPPASSTNHTAILSPSTISRSGGCQAGSGSAALRPPRNSALTGLPPRRHCPLPARSGPRRCPRRRPAPAPRPRCAPLHRAMPSGNRPATR